MKGYSSWRQAVFLSICIHCLLFVGIALFVIVNHTAELPTDYSEMELVSDPTITFSTATQSAKQLQTVPVQGSTPSPTETSEQKSSNVSGNRVGKADKNDVPTAIAGYSDHPGESVATAEAVQSFSSNLNTESSARIKSEILPPQILRRVEPAYPEQARLQGWEGKVTVRVEVLTDGIPGDITVKKSSGYPLLDDAAILAIKSWQFIPAKSTATDMPEVCYTSVSLIFRLN